MWHFEKENCPESISKLLFNTEKKNFENDKSSRRPYYNAPEKLKQLLFAETISREIREPGKEKKNK